jgi:hypothetical protein
MNDRLKHEYEKYLAHYGLKPRRLPPRQDREAGQDQAARVMYEEAKSRGDPMAEGMWIAYQENRERYLTATQHPATIEIEQSAADVEATIRAVPAFADRFHDDVFVGEFPTGSINCETVRVDGGFLVLVNSGTLTMLQQVVTFLCRGDPDHTDSEASLGAVDGVGDVLSSYIEHGDPYYGPKPLNGGMLAMLSSLLSGAARTFAVAHEYGHILASHFSEADLEQVGIETKVGAIEVLKKSNEQEFEADELGYRLTLGVGTYDQFDLALIEAGGNTSDLTVMRAGLKQKCLLAGPFVPLTVDLILSHFMMACQQLGNSNKFTLPATHPRAIDRIGRLLDFCPSHNPKYSGFINYPFMLLPSVERIVAAMLKQHFQRQ